MKIRGALMLALATASVAPVALAAAPAQAVPTVTRTFQVDRYIWRDSATEGRKVTALDDDGLLQYREDSWMWMQAHAKASNRWEIVTVTLPATATTAQWISAINSKTTIEGNFLTTTAKQASTGAASGYESVAWEVKSDSWMLGRDPKKFNKPQVFFARR